ncbi:carbohydrate kinase [Halosquirtibacter xylanolyticus]|uniref:xylulokinase n=1 Tax=Halosquirtibacter xylanolyticus TaxID=3374599 RepID=UPI003748B9D7|nr:carbohydrate kinase [Prolixibacteraceae bacterium]
MYTLGFDIGSSSVKVSLLDVAEGSLVGSSFSPKQEMTIESGAASWAEQDPMEWWKHLQIALDEVLSQSPQCREKIQSIGISYQMHGLVLVDSDQKLLRPSIIWCDSRAVEIGRQAQEDLGKDYCLSHLLNSPGNFTASKLKWVKDNEPSIYEKIDKFMLPGDFIAMMITGKINTTVGGLSEGIFWDFPDHEVSRPLLAYYGFTEEMVPDIEDTFTNQGQIKPALAAQWGLPEDVVVSYRAGDQPNNALSLNVLEPGEVAATAGTSGVVYGISDRFQYDNASRINSFAHVNHQKDAARVGVLLCINGTGILNAWLRRNVGSNLSYDELNRLAEAVPCGSEGLRVYPFGNGAERVLENRNVGASIENLHFNLHGQGHMIRAAHEAIAYSFYYGMEVMQEAGIDTKVIRAGYANMFLSPIFRETLSDVAGANIELYETDGALGAARAAAYGSGCYFTLKEACGKVAKIETIEPNEQRQEMVRANYKVWKRELEKKINQ